MSPRNLDLGTTLQDLFHQLHIFMEFVCLCRPPDKSAYWKIIYFISHLKHVVGTQKNRLNETVLLSTQNTCLY